MLSEYGIIDQLVVYIRFISLERVNYNQRLLYIFVLSTFSIARLSGETSDNIVKIASDS